jgi:signal transduction histidine kinase
LSLDFDEKQRQRDIEAAQLEYRDEIRMYVLIAGLIILLLLVLIFWRNIRQRKKANLLLQEQKEELQTAMEKLQQTQDQLVQSEKMASLGELTAGIAHEIQNPLNFVNNFSEVNMELISEMQTELDNGDKSEVVAILEDIKQNLEKISHHGRRADGIVKGMLQHSRSGSNTKEPTDINKLADEYLRLAYHGLRAKDKSFNAELIVNFNENLPALNVVAQDIGRVVLNLFTNAFYAVHQKQKKAGSSYQPKVSLSTDKENNQVIIKVKDNGVGISANIKDKIMQPFFTTKPAGEGTGLGLSMSYEIVVNVHGGKIEADSKEGEYTEFIIKLPI